MGINWGLCRDKITRTYFLSGQGNANHRIQKLVVLAFRIITFNNPILLQISNTNTWAMSINWKELHKIPSNQFLKLDLFPYYYNIYI